MKTPAPSHHIEGKKSRRRGTKKGGGRNGNRLFSGYASGPFRCRLVFANSSITPLASLEFDKRLEQPGAVEVWPKRIRHIDFRIINLPQEEIAHAHLAARTDEQVGVRQPGGVQAPGNLLFGHPSGR